MEPGWGGIGQSMTYSNVCLSRWILLTDHKEWELFVMNNEVFTDELNN